MIDNLRDFWLNMGTRRIVMTVALIILGLIIYTIIERAINRILDRKKEINKKRKTLVKLFSNLAKYVILTIVVILILKMYGINVNSLVAGLGLVSVVAGLAIQDPLKDLISGINIISDDYYSLGDVVNIDGIEGKVIQLNIRTTKIQDIKTSDIYTIANRNISKVKKVSNELYIDIPLSYEDDIRKVETILNGIVNELKEVEHVQDAKYLGLNDFEESSMIYKMKILCKPEYRYSVKRDVNRVIKIWLDRNHISIPYPQITIHRSNT